MLQWCEKCQAEVEVFGFTARDGVFEIEDMADPTGQGLRHDDHVEDLVY